MTDDRADYVVFCVACFIAFLLCLGFALGVLQ